MVNICKFCKEEIPNEHPRFMKIKEGKTYEMEYQVCMSCKGRLNEVPKCPQPPEVKNL